MTDNELTGLFRDLVGSGIKNLSIYRDHVNELNVFPVPDGDTGTNMVLTLENGFALIREFEGEFSEMTRRFADNIVLGARGNSGVILSQFFRGFAASLSDSAGIDSAAFIKAVRRGVELSYRSVAEPVEGTMLTVMREGAEHIEGLPGAADMNIGDLLDAFIDAARISLENTPNLLPVLKAARVIDSGGAGFVYIFEGMLKYLNNEEIVSAPETQEKTAFVDYSRFDMTSSFPLGYCTEMLIQLTEGSKPFDKEEFVEKLSGISESIVVSRQDDKVKVHAHSPRPEGILSLCHEYGEFLTLKIENMTVQHTETHKIVETAPNKKTAGIAVIAVANDSFMKGKFFDMGADVVINAVSGYNPSAKDFMEAYEATGADVIFVFPNCKNSLFVAEQANELYGRAKVLLIETRSVAECYAALALMDYESEEPEELAKEMREAVSQIRTVTVSRAVKDAYYGAEEIKKGDRIALSAGELLATGSSFAEVTERAIEKLTDEEPCDVMTFFFGEHSSPAEKEEILSFVENRYPMTDTDVLETDTELYDLIISLE
ncbi:MAG: DAK2 domain-containing protein [Clostridiales bacterium]|nr:DAK2 domain-containing protein [Clostridiales bacterium]